MANAEKKPDAGAEFTPLQSSQLSAFHYDAPSKTLKIKFTSGATYQYDGVEPGITEGLKAAKPGDVGKFFTKHIRPIKECKRL